MHFECSSRVSFRVEDHQSDDQVQGIEFLIQKSCKGNSEEMSSNTIISARRGFPRRRSGTNAGELGHGEDHVETKLQDWAVHDSNVVGQITEVL